ncbi:unnamed protein product [Phytophthora fragariaefolia]|uniref:Unnamed protein product n=1 Tax=Phytophthora fragariaefolia TaxID=1490495 RepID=A0A9W6WZX9_9STRA|nr:unnamed protein product [Phytophthora fragariaefolia]
MSTPTSEEEYAGREPSTWHQQKHGSSDFCKRMKNYCATKGELRCLKWLHDYCDAEFSAEAMDGAATNGHLEVVKWIHDVFSESSTTMRRSTNSSTDVTPSWNFGLYSGDSAPHCTTAAMDGAAMNGHLSVVKWLHKNRTEGCTASAMDEAARNGHFNVVLWLHCNRKEGCTTAAIDGAASNGYLTIVEWLHKARSEGCTAQAMINAASKGFLEVVEYLYINLGQAASNAAITVAASNGHLPVVQYLHENRSECCTAYPIAGAKENGHGSVVEFLLEHEECRRAYEEGNLMVDAEGRATLEVCVRDCQTFNDESSSRVDSETRVDGNDTSNKLPSSGEHTAIAIDRQAELEARLRAEVEASIRAEEGARIRAEVEAAVRAEQEEAILRAKIRVEIQHEVEEKMRAEIRAELLAKKKAEPCTICFGKIDDPITTTCDHTFCAGCLAKWRSRGHELCPMCRACIK